MLKRLITVSMSALLIIGGLAACSSGEEQVPSSSQQQGINMEPIPGAEGTGMESETDPISGDSMDSETTDPSMGGTDEPPTDPTMNHETEPGDSSEETSVEEQTINPAEETEGTDPSSGTTGS